MSAGLWEHENPQELQVGKGTHTESNVVIPISMNNVRHL